MAIPKEFLPINVRSELVQEPQAWPKGIVSNNLERTVKCTNFVITSFIIHGDGSISC